MPGRPTQQDVLLALLSYDAYSRGVNPQLRYTSDETSTLATTIGTATWVQSSDNLPGATSVGFSASQYTLTNAKTVIAYRGTDFPTDWSNPAQLLALLQDIGTGWLGSFGVTGTQIGGQNLQPGYARQFYELVTGRNLFAQVGNAPTDLIITGHSLGGGLAGFIGSLSRAETVIFNEIPYLGMALTAAIDAAQRGVIGRADAASLISALWDQIGLANPGGAGAGGTSDFNLPVASAITSFRMSGEIANLARILGPFLGPLSSAYLPNWLVSTPERAAAALLYGSTADLQQTVVGIDSNGGLRNPISLHSQTLMVLVTYAASKSLEDWKEIGPKLLDALFDGKIGIAAGTQTLGGYGGDAARLMGTIAYSAVEPGTGLVFGDTGIRALFNDADELGKLVKDGRVSQALKDAIPGIRGHDLVSIINPIAVCGIRGHDLVSIINPIAVCARSRPQSGDSYRFLSLRFRKRKQSPVCYSSSPAFTTCRGHVHGAISTRSQRKV